MQSDSEVPSDNEKEDEESEEEEKDEIDSGNPEWREFDEEIEDINDGIVNE